MQVKSAFSIEERVSMIKSELLELEQDPKKSLLKVDSLLVSFAKEKQATVIIRGLRLCLILTTNFKWPA